MKLAEKLIYLRKEKRLSQLKLAELMNVSRQAVSRWEVGAATPSIENLKYLSGLYGVSMEYLLDDSEDGPGERVLAPAGTGGGFLGKKAALKLAIAAVCIFALGAGAAFGFMGLGNRENSRDAVGEIGSNVYAYDGYTIKKADEESIGGSLNGHGIVKYDGGLVGGDASGEIGSRVYDGYTIKEADGELIGGRVYDGYTIIKPDGEIGLVISHPALEK